MHRPAVLSLPPACRYLVLTVLVFTPALIAGSGLHWAADREDLWEALVLVLAAAVTTGLWRRGAGAQKTLPRYITTSSCWLLPAVLLLPLSIVAPVALLLEVVVNRLQRHGPLNFRLCFSFFVTTLAATSAAAAATQVLPQPLTYESVTGGVSFLLGLCVVMAVYLTVDHLTVVAVWLSDPATSWRQAKGDPAMDAMELSLTSLGALYGLLLDANLALVVLAIPIPWVLQRLTGMGLFFQQADHDAKTGLLHLIAWTDAATRSLARARTAGSPVVVVIVDLDNFKSVNDRYGHLVGDAVLLLTADILRSGLRPDSLVARFGGEEFVLLLPDTDAATGAAVADRLRGQLELQRIPVGEDTLCVTASFGVAATSGHETLNDLLASADRALYQAKHAGRNRVHMSDETSAAVTP